MPQLLTAVVVFVLLLPLCLAAVSLLRHLAGHPVPDRGFAEVRGGEGQGGAGGGGGEEEAAPAAEGPG